MLLLPQLPASPEPPAPTGLCKVGSSRRKTPFKRLRGMKALGTLPLPNLRPPVPCVDVSPLSPSGCYGREGGRQSSGPDPAATKASLSSSRLLPVPSPAA